MKKVLLCFLIIILLSGCSIKNENNMVITEDGKVNYSIIIGFDKEILTNIIKAQYLGENIYNDVTDEDMLEYVSNNIKDKFLEGLNKKNYIDNDFIGIEYQYHVDNINEISANKAGNIIINNFNQDEKLIDKKLFSKERDLYIANFIYEKIDKNEYSNENINYYNIFKVTLPTQSKSNNANKITDNGKTLIWELNNNENYNINFTFKLNDNTPKYFILVLSIIVISVIIIYSIKIKKELKK